MHYESAVETGVDHASKKKARLGVLLFFLYLFFYAGFVVIGVFNYELLSREAGGGMNLALIYGMGLIFFAVLMGILYNYLCSGFEDNMNEKEPTS